MQNSMKEESSYPTDGPKTQDILVVHSFHTGMIIDSLETLLTKEEIDSSPQCQLEQLSAS